MYQSEIERLNFKFKSIYVINNLRIELQSYPNNKKAEYC